jgi:hypothetical protein
MDAPGRATTSVSAPPSPADPKSPSVSQLHPLDMLLIGSLHPPIAEMLGLAWTDRSIPRNVPCDYMVVADHAGAAGGDPHRLLAYLTARGFDARTDAWIVYDVTAEHQPPYRAPEHVVVYALPGGSMRDASGGLQLSVGGASVDWPRGVSAMGWLNPDASVAHHVYRRGAGAAATPAVPAEATDWLTKNLPLVYATPVAPPTAPTATSSIWPPGEPAYLDLRLDEGWYVYQVVAVDIFGRFSPKSAFAAWWQWTPPPVPPPWYYSGSGAAVVNPKAVRILDKTRPPIPLGLEAYVLDPDDPILVRDAAYKAWRTSLGPAGAATIGLRARWRWSPQQQQRAPKVTEFRLYWSGGSAPPTGWTEPPAWPDRVFACPIGSNVTTEAGGTLSYEVFLPQAGGGPLAAGVPLAPSLADPVAYANVSVTAADNVAHSADRWPGGGAFGGRPGNESQCAPPQRVFRVRRTQPAPPEAIVDSERVYATPADWHGRSFHTFRWAPQPPLLTHVLRALDEAVFETDWTAQPQPTLSISDSAFPDAVAEPIWNTAKKTQVARLINAIAAVLPTTPTASQKAAQKAKAFGLYRGLPDDALRVLANRVGNEKAFVQITLRPLAASDATDRRGPDDAPGYAPSPGRCAFLDEMDGRSSNRMLYRAMLIDGAQNRSQPGPCGTPVRLPDVVAPQAPAVTKALGGDRQITLAWASNREPDLLEYRIFQADSERDARDLRTMTEVAVVEADPRPANRPATVTWTHVGLIGLRDFWYRVAAVDRLDPDPRGGGGNLSAPSPAIRVRAFDATPPTPPAITTAEWVRIDETGAVFPYAAPPPPNTVRDPAVRLTWPSAGPDTRLLVQMKGPGGGAFANASGWMAPGATGFIGRRDRTFETVEVRLKMINGAGNANLAFLPTSIAPP